MAGEPTQHRKAARLALVIGLGVPALAVTVLVLFRLPVWLALRDLSHPDAKIRRAAVRELGGRRVRAAGDRIAALILSDPDPAVREAAAYAASRLGVRVACESIREAVQRWPDEPGAAQMLASLARLTGKDARLDAFLESCRRSGRPYLRIGAALAQMERGDSRGVIELLTLGLSAPEPVIPVVVDRVCEYVIPAIQMAGGSVPAAETSRGFLSAVLAWWESNGSDRLLADSLKSNRLDADTHEVERLEHARQRVGRALGLLPSPSSS